jgi:hypothetical protein
LQICDVLMLLIIFCRVGDVPTPLIIPATRRGRKPCGGKAGAGGGRREKHEKAPPSGVAPEKIRHAVALGRIHRFGEIQLTVTDLSHPDPDIAVRPVSENHVLALMKSFSYHQSVPDPIHVVVRDDALIRKKNTTGLQLQDLKGQNSKFTRGLTQQPP